MSAGAGAASEAGVDSSVVAQMAHAGVVPVIVLDDPRVAGLLAAALTAGGLGCAEITLRSPAAIDVLAAVAAVNGFLAGAGTVTTRQQATAAVAAGARFLVSPGLSAAVVGEGRAAGVPVIPGIATATELMAALELGVSTVKFFPAEPLGGVAALRALSAVFPAVSFFPTGGIGPESALQYLRLPSVLAVGGSWITPPGLLRAGDFGTVTGLARAASLLVEASRGSHSAGQL